MSDQPPSEESMGNSNKGGRKLSNALNKNGDRGNNEAPSNSSWSNVMTDAEKEEKIILERVLKMNNYSPIQLEQAQTIKENTKPKTFKLPTELNISNRTYERDFVGDDLNKKSEIHILCECEPNVAGAAVPVIKSCTPSENLIGESNSNVAPVDSRKNVSYTDSTTSRYSINSCEQKNTEFINEEAEKDILSLDITPDENDEFKRKKLTSSQESDRTYYGIIEKASSVTKNLLKKAYDEKNDFNSNKQPKKQKESILVTENRSLHSRYFIKKPTTGLKNANEENNDLNKNKKSKKIQETKAVDKSNTNSKLFLRKPSLIPKLTRPNGNNRRDYVKEGTESGENVSHSSSKELKIQSNKICPKVLNVQSDKQLKTAETIPSTISTRMLGLQERLKATTSMLRQKIEMDKTKDKLSTHQSGGNISPEEEHLNKDISTQNKKTVEDLYKNLFHLREIASSLSDNNTLRSQIQYIEKLFANISEIKIIADKLCECEYNQVKEDIDGSSISDGSLVMEKDKIRKTSASAKDNKIYIKFMHSRERKYDKKKCEQSPEQSEKVQADLAVDSKVTSESLNSEACGREKNKEDEKIKESDSMDGIFIPTCEPPKNLEEEDELNGLDITITFPELNQMNANNPESHLSVCLSDISAEALRKLKRCPKDFTLRMDFVEGKILFQSGKGPTNNFSIGPDLKFSEHTIDTKKSDIINIKPSTECSFASQLIPVENTKEIKSFKSLKSVDSELFNVVNLPFMYKNHYLATSHKSCITFTNDKLISVAILARQFFKSMPQIPSLTHIFEDKILDSPSKTVVSYSRSMKSYIPPDDFRETRNNLPNLEDSQSCNQQTLSSSDTREAS